MKHWLSLWLLLVLLIQMPGAAWATAGPPAAGRPLAEALNPDGTLKAGAAGSFDARAFRMQTAPDGRPVFSPAGTAGVGDERWADGFGLPNGTDGTVLAVVQSGSNTYIGGNFALAGGTVAKHVAKWDGTAWNSLGTGAGNGVNGAVSALAVASNGEVYVGGYFNRAGGVAANKVAKWNGTAWTSLGTGTGNGVSGNVDALAVAGNGEVYVGGSIIQAGGTTVSNVAKWNGTAWSSLGMGVSGGVNSLVRALAVAVSGEVYVGGNFTQAGGTTVSNVAKWNGAAWSSLGTGVSGDVGALAVTSSGEVYVGGVATGRTGGVTVSHIAKWDGAGWSTLGAGVSSNSGFVAIGALAVASNGEVYVGGNFSRAGGVAANNVAKWNGTAWTSLGTGTSNGVSGDVYALAVAGSGQVYAGGSFTQTGAGAANYFSKWNGMAWNSLGTGVGNGVNGSINMLAVASTGDVYVGGSFTQAGGVAANYVAKWNGTTWSGLGTGVNGTVNALAVAGSGDVYVAGYFNQAGGVTANVVAKWNGTAWSSLGTGVDGTAYVLAVAVSGEVYVGGSFTRVGGVSANSIARWSGTAWSSLGTGVSGKVVALAVAVSGEVYVGGDFTQAGGVTANYVAKWNGTAWSSLGMGAGNGVDSYVYALAVASTGDVYVGGRFTQAGGVAANYVAKWNGTTWSSLGMGASNGLAALVSTLALAGPGELYVGGDFTQAGGTPANHVAKWNGTAWSSLGTGLTNEVYSLAWSASSKLYMGGSLVGTGDGSKAMAHFGIYDPNAPLATTATRAAPAAQLFPNPAHGTATLRLPAAAARQPLLLSDALGRLVRQYPAPAGPEAVLDLRGLPAGVYWVRCGALSQRLVVE